MPSDPELRVEVISLLAAHDTAEGFIEQEAAQRVGLASAAPKKDWIGQRLGPYRIVGEAGRGGMSQVFKAVRDDQQYEKQVAIKLLKPGLDTDSLLRRFKAERQILAQLSHPNIAHLLDGGATEDGAPYLVMEYIEGKPIDAYCDDRGLGVNERIERYGFVLFLFLLLLFLFVCVTDCMVLLSARASPARLGAPPRERGPTATRRAPPLPRDPPAGAARSRARLFRQCHCARGRLPAGRSLPRQ